MGKDNHLPEKRKIILVTISSNIYLIIDLGGVSAARSSFCIQHSAAAAANFPAIFGSIPEAAAACTDVSRSIYVTFGKNSSVNYMFDESYVLISIY